MKKVHLIVAVIVLLGLFGVLAAGSMKLKSPTIDEIAHLPAGFSYLKTMDYRMNPEHPPLIKMISALPLFFYDIDINLNSESWKDAAQWDFGMEFLSNSINTIGANLFMPRMMIVILGVLLGFFVFRWTNRLYGEKAALLALFLYALSPNILAHTRLITTDLGVACFSFIAMYYLWEQTQKPRTKNIALAGIFLGLALASKFTALLLIPIILGIAAYEILKKKSICKKRIESVFLIIVISIFVLAATYGITNFNYYFAGIAKDMEPSLRIFHMMGSVSETGFLSYFVVTFLIKTPLAMLILILAALGLYKKYSKRKFSDELFLILPIVGFFIAMTFLKLNIGHRHILIIYPFLFVFVSKLANIDVFTIKHKSILKFTVVILCIFYATSSIIAYPHYLPYFNEAIGGQANGYKYLSDSNIDWGQDVYLLQEWLRDNQDLDPHVGYFGKIKVAKGLYEHGIGCEPLKGTVVIGVSILNSVIPDIVGCYDWLKEYEPVDNIGYSILIYDIS